MTEAEDLLDLATSGLTDPADRMKVLSYRVAVLVREKEELELRVAKMERAFNMGAGILLVLPIAGSVIGMILAFGSKIFKPWLSQ